MPERKINDSVMLAMLDKGKKQAEVAQFFGVSPQAVSDRVKKLKGGMVKVAIMEKGAEVLDKNLNAVDQLRHINEVANKILDELTGEEETTKRMVQAVKAVLDCEKEPTKDNLKNLKAIILHINRDKNTAIKACGEIRAQLSLQLEILQGLYNVESVAAFQKEVVAIIGEVEPDVRNRIIQKLKERLALRNTVSFT